MERVTKITEAMETAVRQAVCPSSNEQTTNQEMFSKLYKQDTALLADSENYTYTYNQLGQLKIEAGVQSLLKRFADFEDMDRKLEEVNTWLTSKGETIVLKKADALTNICERLVIGQ
jgi:hypothetical protein